MNQQAKLLTTTLIISVIALLFYFNTGKNPNTIVGITGEITNPKGDTIRIYNADTLFISTLNEIGEFSIKFNWSGSDFLISIMEMK